ncbi:AraC family transcriptional regulator [Rhodopseudomonas palustris]|uniref:AraC family transcriptional regulator n=1 Tax=Rhodopseudomonas palustris TaxID=1076 RepID=A0A323UNQ5_RHOPL|nr:helix-turn-helix domain-containing protein [Rhodopseudomonas palustris]PZA13937.1 AraC family transcriptional regulator [Rhodopseudomonas palustris]
MSETAADPRILEQTLADLRAATTDICDVTPLGPPADFHITSTTRLAGGWLLIDTASPPLQYDRSAAHVARGGLDHYQFTLCLQGQMRFASGRREITLQPGDICLIDMAKPNRTVLIGDGDQRSRLVTLIVPRLLLVPRLAHPDSVTATLLPAADRRARLLADQFAVLLQQSDSANAAADSKTAVEFMCDVMAEVAGRSTDARGAVGRAERELLLAAIKHHIDTHLDTGALSVDGLVRRFQVSRASLYRLFGPDGGLARYVQDQRLNRALRLLITPGARGQRLIDLAVDLQFSGDSTFVRAFRRQFGMTPGEIRELSEAWLRETGGVRGPDDLLHRLVQR